MNDGSGTSLPLWKGKMTPFDTYLQKHGHLPRVKLPSGRSAYAGNGYIAIEQGTTRVYVPREDLSALLRFAHRTGRLMQESFDPRQAMQEAMDAEEEYLREQRQQKKTRYRPRRT